MRILGSILLTAALLAVVAACGDGGPDTPEAGAAPPAESPTSTTQPLVAAPPTVTPAPPAAAPVPTSTAKVGTDVGNRIPDFDFMLTDGSTVTTTDLLATGRPAFIFFYAEY